LSEAARRSLHAFVFKFFLTLCSLTSVLNFVFVCFCVQPTVTLTENTTTTTTNTAAALTVGKPVAAFESLKKERRSVKNSEKVADVTVKNFGRKGQLCVSIFVCCLAVCMLIVA